MYTLAFDTTAAACSVILLRDGKTLSRWSRTMEFGQAEVLILQIKNILEEQKLSFSDLGLLAVCTGPGSFTGVRASISAARAFGLNCRLPAFRLLTLICRNFPVMKLPKRTLS